MVSTAVSYNSFGFLFRSGRNQASDCIEGTTNLEKRDGESMSFLFKKPSRFSRFSLPNTNIQFITES